MIYENHDMLKQMYETYKSEVRVYKPRSYRKYTLDFFAFINLIKESKEFDPTLDTDHRLNYNPDKPCRWQIFPLGWHSSVQKSRLDGFSFTFYQYLVVEIYFDGKWDFNHFTTSNRQAAYRGVTRNLMPDILPRKVGEILL